MATKKIRVVKEEVPTTETLMQPVSTHPEVIHIAIPDGATEVVLIPGTRQIFSCHNDTDRRVVVKAEGRDGVSIQPGSSVWLQAKGEDFRVIGLREVLAEGFEVQ